MYQFWGRIPGHLMRLMFLGLGMTYALSPVAEERPKSGVFTVAVFGDAVFIGQAFPFGERGKFHLKGYRKSDGECDGTYLYQEFPRGRATFSCTNGLSGRIKIRADTPMTGNGTALIQGRKVNLVFGYGLEQTNRLLDLPGDRELAIRNDALVLIEPR